MLFRIYFKVIFRKIGIRFGWFRCFIELFNIFFVWFIVNLLLIIVIWFFICNCNWGFVIRFIFEWLMWVILVLKLLWIFNCVNVLLFSLGLVIRIWCEISFLFSCFYFILIGLLKNVVIVFIFIGVVIINILLFRWSLVLEFINFDFFFLFKCWICDIIKLWFINGCIFLICLLWRVLLWIFNEIGWIVNFCKCFSFCLVLVFFCLVLIWKRYLRFNSDMMYFIMFNG